MNESFNASVEPGQLWMWAADDEYIVIVLSRCDDHKWECMELAAPNRIMHYYMSVIWNRIA